MTNISIADCTWTNNGKIERQHGHWCGLPRSQGGETVSAQVIPEERGAILPLQSINDEET